MRAKAKRACAWPARPPTSAFTTWTSESGTFSWDARIRGLWGIGLDEPVTYGDVFLDGLHPG